MNNQPQPTPDQAMAAIEDMYVKRMCGIFDALLKQNAIVLTQHDITVAQCVIATTAHELAQLAAGIASLDAQAPEPSSLILPPGVGS